MIYCAPQESPIGPVWLAASDVGLVYCGTPGSEKEKMDEWLKAKLADCPVEEGENEHIQLAKQQLEEYFAGRGRELAVSLDLVGTDFQKQVWQALIDIPYGETRSYGEIAEAVGNPRAARAVGGANHVNPVSLFIP